MKHPNKPGQFKVVVRNGAFFKAPVEDNTLPEADASINERRALMTRVGLVDGNLPGLVEDFARALSRKLESAQRAKGWRRHRRA